MMGERTVMQEALFYSFSLEQHVPADHLLRSIDRFVDLHGIREHLRPFYSETGRPSNDPGLMIRMLIVGYCMGIRSERRLCEEVHLNLAYHWFCRLGLDGAVPDHSSLSMEPPALLACINRSTRIHAVLERGTPFCVNLLSAEHQELSGIFGGQVDPARRFNHGDWIIASHGIPYLADAESNIFCTVDAMFDYATHSIVVGQVNAVRLPRDDVRPLIFGDGRFLIAGRAGH
jgi:hypothetical protein